MHIGALARRAGVGVDTIRYYERRGLLRPVARTPSRYRLYGPDAVARLRFIRRGRALGFSLDQIGELLALQVRHDAPCDEARRQAELRLADVDLRIRRLERIRSSLRKLVDACARRAETEECPILSALAGEESGLPAPSTAADRGRRLTGEVE